MTLILAFLFSLTGAFSGSSLTKQTSPFVVVIDASHGGSDHGDKNVQLGLIEKKLSLKLSQMLSDQFDTNYKIILTRSVDKSISDSDRIKFVNGIKPHLYISIHFGNEMNSDEFGMRALFADSEKYKEDSEYYAGFFLEEFIDLDEMLPVRQPTTSPNKILNAVDCPAVMLNLGSFDNSVYNEFLLRDKNVAEISYLIAAAIRGIKNDY